jgi:hypothetical protein
MFSIRSSVTMADALDSPLDPKLKCLLRERRDQLAEYELSDVASFLIVQVGDGIDAIEAELGLPIMTNVVDGARYGDPDFEPSWEYIVDHGGWFEAVYILSDDGFGHVLLIEDCDGVDADLLALCREYCSNEREPGRYEGPEHP